MPPTKLEKELKPDEDGTVLVPKDMVEVTPTAVVKKVKRAMSEKQMENSKRLIELNKERWAKMRQEKELIAKTREEEEVASRKADEEEKIQAGTHVRVKLAEKRQYKPRVPKERAPSPLPLKRQNGRYRQETETVTETDDTE